MELVPMDILSSQHFTHKTVMYCGIKDTIVAHILDIENGNGWKICYQFADALRIGQDVHRRGVMEMLNFPDVDLA